MGGVRTRKDSLRIEAFGAVDEANAAIGALRAANRRQRRPATVKRRLDGILRRVQSEMFALGSELATPPDRLHPKQPVVRDAHVGALESEIDEMNSELPHLKSFVLPNGGPVGSAAHLARTTCRRAERAVVALSRKEKVRPEALRYLNRLSDHLFVLGRWAAKKYREPETLWLPE